MVDLRNDGGRGIFSAEHEQFRETVARFVDEELVPQHHQWEKDECVPREIWKRAGEVGILCPNIPEAYGGFGADWLYNVVVIEELAKKGITGPGFTVHSEMVAPYILAAGTEELKQEVLPKMVSGEYIGALGLTEPGAGSDVKEIRTRAVKDGDGYVLNGQKVYISNGQLADVMVCASKTDPAAGAKGVSLIAVDTHQEGFKRGRNLEKIGLKAQDTSEIFLEDVRAPAYRLLGKEGGGFGIMMGKLAQERLTQAVRSICVAEAAIQWTVDYATERKMFGQTLADFQNTQFVLAELSAEVLSARVFTDWCIKRFMAGELTGVEAAKVKLVVTNLHVKVVDQCLQFFGGYGYMTEYPIARAYIDARIVRIAGGAAEVMKQIIGRDLFKK
ncbi:MULTISPECIES: acyl-CoA dehydrogenase family protein [Sphingobium]|uniref:acyl-CoA dehydrogenase family protein n=1 Tax=Sphingobium sp. MI1205 TaxID=407020 RepID=UPI0007701C4F|nr:acyl-CoA dehydrogenase family protein [Sphingobium sp. MI1205]AMK19808.1 Long-chain specific acyl-CoA dehydrogenase [Sphingobium sp. MI1205]